MKISIESWAIGYTIFVFTFKFICGIKNHWVPPLVMNGCQSDLSSEATRFSTMASSRPSTRWWKACVRKFPLSRLLTIQ